MDFDISRLRRCDRIIGISAVAFFIFLFFFKWYGVSSNVSTIAGVNVNISRNGWNTFTNSRWIWLLTILVALAAVAVVAGQVKLELPVKPGVIVTGLGALSVILILYRIIDHPTASASFGSFHASVGIKIGIWLGLIAAAGVTYGGYLAMQDEGVSLPSAPAAGGASSSAPPAAPAPVAEPAQASTAPAPSPPVPPPAPPTPPPAPSPPVPPPAPESSGEAPPAS